jgi:hypothetical protein
LFLTLEQAITFPSFVVGGDVGAGFLRNPVPDPSGGGYPTPYYLKRGGMVKKVVKKDPFSSFILNSQSFLTFPFFNKKFMDYKPLFGDWDNILIKNKKALWYFLSYFYYRGTFEPLILTPLIEMLIGCFFKSILFGNLVSLKYKKIPGVYVIFNRATYRCYIGESVDILNRLNSHFLDLIEGKHPNERLQRDFNIFGKKHFYPLIFDYGEAYELKADRLKVEKDIIQNWPWEVYNIINKKK